MQVGTQTPVNYILNGQSVAMEWTDADSDTVIDATETVTYLQGLSGPECRIDGSTGEASW